MVYSLVIALGLELLLVVVRYLAKGALIGLGAEGETRSMSPSSRVSAQALRAFGPSWASA